MAKDNNSNTPDKPDLDLDALSDDKPASKRRGPSFGEKVDFAKSSKENEGKYISVGQIEELFKMTAKERERIMQHSLTQKNREDLEDHKKMLTEIGAKMSKHMQSMLTLPNLPKFKVPIINVPDLTRYTRPEPVSSYAFHIEPKPTAKEQYKQTHLLEEMVNNLKAQNQQDNSLLLSLIEPRFDRRKRTLIFANTPVQFVAGSDAAIVCGRLFRSGKPVKHPVEKGELIDLLSIYKPTHAMRMKDLYNRIAAINKIIEKQTNADNFFKVVDKKVWFNTNYVKLPL